MRVEFDTKQDQQRMQDFAAFDLQVLEAYLREHFLADRSKDASASVDQLAEEWRDVWENRILPTEANGVTLRDAYRNQSYAFQSCPPTS